jgi:hypothetical protein
MNTLEDRLRDALRERAARSPVNPDAWERTVARSRRQTGRSPRWTQFMIPAAAAAAVVAIVVGATALTGHGGSRGGSVSYPAGSVSPTAGTMTAYLLDGRLIGFNGRVVGFWESDSSSVISGVPVSGPQAVVNVGGSWLRGAKVVEFYGYAHANVTRVVLRLPDGRQYGAPTTTAWPGSGLRLWHFAVPVNAATSEPGQQVLLGYDDAGRVVWQKPLRESG